MALTPQQLDVLTRTVLGEAANQGIPGMAGVASVIRNRAQSGKFPSDPTQVALQPWQFSAWNSANHGGNNVGRNADPSSRSYQDAAAVVNAVFNGQIADPTNGALYYHTGAVHPSWDQSMTPTAQIGAHTFYAPQGQATGPGMGLAYASQPQQPQSPPQAAINASAPPQGLAALSAPSAPPGFNPQAADRMITGEFNQLQPTAVAQQSAPPNFGQALSAGIGGALKALGGQASPTGLAGLSPKSYTGAGGILIPLLAMNGQPRNTYGDVANGLGLSSLVNGV